MAARRLGDRVLAPALVGVGALAVWEAVVRWQSLPPYILPGPVLVACTVVTDWGTLFPSLLVTLAITAAAFLVAAVLGLALAVVFTQSAFIERAFFPYAVILQVTPIVAIAPLIILWVKWIPLALRQRLTVLFVTHSVFESVYLGSRVVVLSPRPGRIAAEFRVEAPAPRGEAFRTSAAYLDACRHVSALLARAMEAR